MLTKQNRKNKKKFNLVDSVLTMICVILVIESASTTAIMGPSQYFWWIFLIITFIIPYALITTELSSTYPEEGGIYSWIKRAFGLKLATRCLYMYWISLPLWTASLAIIVTSTMNLMFNITFSDLTILVIQLVFVWLSALLCLRKINTKKFAINLGATFKIILMLLVGVLGIYVAFRSGEVSINLNGIKEIIPKFDFNSLSMISVIIFNSLGFEVVSTFINDMENPKRDVIKTIIIVTISLSLIYLLTSTGILISVESNLLNMDDGLVFSFLTLFNKLGLNQSLISVLIIIVGFMFIYTLITTIISWSHGINSITKACADDGMMNSIFSKEKNGILYGGVLVNSMISSIVLIIGYIISVYSPCNTDTFKLFFSMCWITMLISYLPMFFAFLRLRKDKVERVFKVPGKKKRIRIIAILPFVVLLFSIILSIFGDFSLEFLIENAALIEGLVIFIIIQEILVRIYYKKRKM